MDEKARRTRAEEENSCWKREVIPLKRTWLRTLERSIPAKAVQRCAVGNLQFAVCSRRRALKKKEEGTKLLYFLEKEDCASLSCELYSRLFFPELLYFFFHSVYSFSLSSFSLSLRFRSLRFRSLRFLAVLNLPAPPTSSADQLRRSPPRPSPRHRPDTAPTPPRPSPRHRPDHRPDTAPTPPRHRPQEESAIIFFLFFIFLFRILPPVPGPQNFLPFQHNEKEIFLSKQIETPRYIDFPRVLSFR